MTDNYSSQDIARRNFKGTKILLVEDNPDHCLLIKSVLQVCMPDVQLLTAATAEQAISQLTACTNAKERLPRLILLDLYLPRREDGWQLLRRLKADNSPYRLLPVTLLSQSEEPDDIYTSYDLGGTSYIVKPAGYPQWLAYFEALRQYWWYTVTLPHR